MAKFGGNMRYEIKKTPWKTNFILFTVGLIIVWVASHSWLAMLGAFIASIHISFRASKEEIEELLREKLKFW